MKSDAAKALGVVLSLVVAIGLLVVWAPKLLGIAGGPQLEILAIVKRAERGVNWQIDGGGELVSQQLQYQRLSVTLDQSGEFAIVTGTLDLTGTFRGVTRVSSLGFERIPFRLVDGDWKATEGLAPRLSKIIAQLEARRRLLDGGDLSAAQGDPAALAQLRGLSHRSYTSTAWFIRSEREGVEVSEDYVLRGDSTERPIHETSTKRLEMTESQSGFLFPRGIM